MSADSQCKSTGLVTELGPRGEAVLDVLMSRLARNELASGSRLGSERSLSQEMGVSRASVRAALSRMQSQGLIYRVAGRGGGVFVGSPKVRRDLSQITAIPQLLREQGFTAGTRTLNVSVRTADQDAALLEMHSDQLVVDLLRIRFANGEPISLENAILPADLVDGLAERDLSGSLYELLKREYALTPAQSTEEIEATTAGPQEASVLGVVIGSPLLSVRRITTNSSGRIFEKSHDLFRGDRTQMRITNGVSEPSYGAESGN